MIIYQANYESVTLSEAANLFISSVPLAIMQNGAETLLCWIDQNIATSGIVLIDMPSKDDVYKTLVNTAAKKYGWEPNWELKLRNVYQRDDCQSLVAFTKMGHRVSKPKDLVYQCFLSVQCNTDVSLILC